MKKTIGILGVGEVGKSLYEVYSDYSDEFDIILKDKNDYNTDLSNVYILNVCIPYSECFFNVVSSEILKNKPKYVIIHSTVPIGTTKKIKETTYFNNICHSPIRGNHPKLKKSIKTFIKYIGCDNKKISKKIKKHYKKIGIRSKILIDSDNTELLKLLCTTYYGLCISWHNEMKKICDYFNLKFENVENWNRSYNDGYFKMKLKKFIRPVLYNPPNGKIEGHCIIPNAKILNKQFESSMIKNIIELE